MVFVSATDSQASILESVSRLLIMPFSRFVSCSIRAIAVFTAGQSTLRISSAARLIRVRASGTREKRR